MKTNHQTKHSSHGEATSHRRSNRSTAATLVLLVSTVFPLMCRAQAQPLNATSITLQDALNGPDSEPLPKQPSDRNRTYPDPHLISGALHLVTADGNPAADNNVRRSLAAACAREPLPSTLTGLADAAEPLRLGAAASWSVAEECGAGARALVPAARGSRWLFGPLAALLAALGIGTQRRR